MPRHVNLKISLRSLQQQIPPILSSFRATGEITETIGAITSVVGVGYEAIWLLAGRGISPVGESARFCDTAASKTGSPRLRPRRQRPRGQRLLRCPLLVIPRSPASSGRGSVQRQCRVKGLRLWSACWAVRRQVRFVGRPSDKTGCGKKSPATVLGPGGVEFVPPSESMPLPSLGSP